MSYYYSASTRAFYCSDIVSVGSMPADKVAVADEEYKSLMDAQNAGKLIRPGAGGAPEAVAQAGDDATGIVHELTAATNSKLGHVKIGAGVSVAGDGTISVDQGGKRDHTESVVNADLNKLLEDKTYSCSGTLKNTPISCSYCVVEAFDVGAPVSGNIVQVCYVLQADNTVRAFWRNVVNGATFGKWRESESVKKVNGIGPDASGNVVIPNATTSKFGLVRLAAEQDVLNEAPQTAVCTQLIYEINEFRRKLTSYKVGDKVDCAFQYERFLECTKAGTTSKDFLDTRNVTHGQVITDGTVQWTVRTHVRSIDGSVAQADGNVILNALSYKKLSSVKSVTGSFWFDSNSGIDPTEVGDGEWTGVQFGMANGNDKTQIIFNGYQWKYRYSDSPLGQEVWSDWESFGPRSISQNYLKLDGTNTMTGTIKSSVNGENSFVGAANGGTIINGTGKNGAFVPLWQYESTNEGSFVVSGYKNAFRIDFLSKENKAAGTNASEWMLSIDETGKMFVPNDLTIGGMLRLKGLGYRNVAYLEDAEAEIYGQEDFVLAGGNQGTFICSGESGANPETTKAFRRSLKRGDEDIVLVADSNVVIATNAQTMNKAEVRKFTITNGGDVRFPSRFYPDIAGGHWNNSPYVLQSGSIERGANPTANQYLYIPFYDKNGIDNAKNRLAKIEFSRRTDGMTYIHMGVNSPANATGETFCGITACWRLSGGEYVAETMVSHHPGADSNDYSAATTKWTRDLLQRAVGKAEPKLTALIDWAAMNAANGGHDVRNINNTTYGIKAYGGDSGGSLGRGDIILKSSYENYDALLIEYTNDSGSFNHSQIWPMWQFKRMMNTKGLTELFTNDDIYWKICGRRHPSTPSTAYRIEVAPGSDYTQNCGIIEIYGITY